MRRIKLKYQVKDEGKICPQCLIKFEVNHGNRIFCVNACKIKFNNQKAKCKFEEVKPTLSILRKNIATLEDFYLNNQLKITTDELMQREFIFDILTNKEEASSSHKGKLMYGSFTLERINNNLFILSKNEK
jgi:hypothetical protein